MMCGLWLLAADFHKKQRKDKTYWYSDKCEKCFTYARVAKTYLLTVPEYLELVAASGGKCEICTRHLVIPFIDHDHHTGQVRGVLCVGCNTALGKFRDSASILESAAHYIRKYESLHTQQPITERDIERKRLALAKRATAKKQIKRGQPSGAKRKRSPLELLVKAAQSSGLWDE